MNPKHELGHFLGLEHSAGLMADTLPAGVRRVVPPSDVASTVVATLETMAPAKPAHARAKRRHGHDQIAPTWSIDH